MKRKILALLLSLAMLLSVGGMVEGTLAVGISVDSTRSSVTLGEVDPTPAPEAESTVETEGTPEGTPAPTVEPTPAPTVEPTPAPTEEPEATPTPTVEPEATPAPEGEAEHIEGCSDDCPAEGCACTCHAAQKTPEDDFASMTDEELYAYVKQLSTDEEIEAFLKQLPEERLNALVAYAQAQEPVVVPETVVFTDAGPFMPPVTVERMLRWNAARAAAADDSADTGNGLELNKTATANGDGSYTIRMEAYTTGTVTTSTKTVPVDIVLVLDQSGSMAYDFKGNETSTNSERRQYAMKQAVNSFIDEVNKKYDEDADHRMAIVTFGSDASTLQGWTYVVDNETDETGKGALQKAISGLPNTPRGATNVAAGMKEAENLMGSGYSYTGTNTQRQKVVIVFTDGVPTTQTNFDVDVANDAISSANTLKNKGVTIYSVGIFKGADPNKIHGDYYYRALIADTPCDGSVNSYWGTTNLSNSNANDFADPDVPAGNRFLNYISNNYTAANIGLEFDDSDGLFGGYKWIITANSQGSNAGYYLTPDEATDLNNIFKTISENIQSANIDLGSETVVKDTVSKYFDLPANTSDIHLYTAAAKADGTFADKVEASGVTATIENGAVSVTGFDFNANFVSKELKSDDTYGKKLIIEFTVTQKGGFLGGNNVVTNGENSGVYDKEGNKVEAFPLPQVNVPIKDVTVTAADKNVYLLGGLTAAQLKEGATVTVGEGTKAVSLDLSKANENYGLADWQTAYVDITVEVKDKDGNAVTDLNALTDDTTYTISVTVAPKTDGAGASGTPATAESGVNSPAANINVFKPVLTFKDSEVYYGDTAPDYTGNLTDTKWKHGDTASTTVTMIGDAPTLALTYTPDSTKIASGKVNTKQDIAVDVTVKINGTDVTSNTTFQHTDCAGKTCTVPEGKEFLLHVKTCQLTITKTDGAANEPYVFTVNKDGVKYTEVTIVGNGSATIYELPVGTYTIAEDTGWSWRFSPSYSVDKVTLSNSNTEGTITCTNTLNKPYWLNGFSDVVKNIFGTTNN